MFGNNNMQQMMKQVKQMQANMEAEQAAIAATDYTGTAPRGVVLATFSGDKVLKDLQINAELIDPNDPESLSDMIIVAVNDGLKKVEDDQTKRLSQFAPNLPFS
jgi:DNA-binding YbaB/EbfC family protein